MKTRLTTDSITKLTTEKKILDDPTAHDCKQIGLFIHNNKIVLAVDGEIITDAIVEITIKADSGLQMDVIKEFGISDRRLLSTHYTIGENHE